MTTIIQWLKRYPKGWNKVEARMWGGLACLSCWRKMENQEPFYMAPELQEYILCKKCRDKILEAAREKKQLVIVHALESEHINIRKTRIRKK